MTLIAQLRTAGDSPLCNLKENTSQHQPSFTPTSLLNASVCHGTLNNPCNQPKRGGLNLSWARDRRQQRTLFNGSEELSYVSILKGIPNTDPNVDLFKFQGWQRPVLVKISCPAGAPSRWYWHHNSNVVFSKQRKHARPRPTLRTMISGSYCCCYQNEPWSSQRRRALDNLGCVIRTPY